VTFGSNIRPHGREMSPHVCELAEWEAWAITGGIRQNWKAAAKQNVLRLRLNELTGRYWEVV